MATDAGQKQASSTPAKTAPATPVAPVKPPVKVVTSKTGTLAKVATPKIPTPPTSTDLNKYVGADTSYQGTLATLQKQLATFLAGQTQAYSSENTNYADTQHQLAGQEDTAQKTALDDYAGRGLAHSTIFGNALQGVNTDFLTKQNVASRSHADAISKLVQGKAGFLDQQIAAKQAAMSAAAARRAQQIMTTGGV